MESINVDAIMSRMNPLIICVLRTPLFHWLLSPGLILIAVTGRRSGRRYTIPVGYQRDSGALIVLVSQARKKQWWRNYREAQSTVIRLRGRERQGKAVLISPDSREFARRVESSLQRMPSMARVFGVTDFDKRQPLSREQHEYLAREIAIVRIDLSETGDVDSRPRRGHGEGAS